MTNEHILRRELENLKETSEKQSKALAEALKIKNDALDAVSRQADTIGSLRQEIAFLQGELNRLAPKPKFKVGQIVRLTGSSGGFHGYHKITSWTRHENCDPGDRIRYNFQPEYATGTKSRYDGTGEQYLVAVSAGEIA